MGSNRTFNAEGREGHEDREEEDSPLRTTEDHGEEGKRGM